jgi:signal transduction histidine kinase
MGFNQAHRSLALSSGMVLSGIAATLAWQAGMAGALALSILVYAWFASIFYWQSLRSPIDANRLAENASDRGPEEIDTLLHRLLLDSAPTPLIALQGDNARALNRASRRLFGTDARILPLPAALLDPEVTHLEHEGRRWRIDRVHADGYQALSSVVALVDVDSEANLAEARANAQLIEVLGHELLNGLAPIVSLAQSAHDAIDADPVDLDLLREILGPLSRRANGLERFVKAYREFARLPAPTLKQWGVEQFVHDLGQGFVRRWPLIELVLSNGQVPFWRFDRDQLYQALWALLHNAAEAVAEVPQARVSLAYRVEADRLTFEISDCGPGVAASSAAHIFRPFHTTKAGGSGIGLSLARQIAYAHGGTVELAGANPTRFRLTLA